MFIKQLKIVEMKIIKIAEKFAFIDVNNKGNFFMFLYCLFSQMS